MEEQAARALCKSDAEGYAKEVVLADFEKPGDSDVVAKLVKESRCCRKTDRGADHPRPGRAPVGRREDAAHGGDEVGVSGARAGVVLPPPSAGERHLLV